MHDVDDTSLTVWGVEGGGGSLWSRWLGNIYYRLVDLIQLHKHFHFGIFMATLSKKSLAPRVLKCTTLVDVFFIYHNSHRPLLYTQLFWSMPSSREDLRKKLHQFLHCLPQKYLPHWRGHEISCLLTLQMLHTKFGLVNQVFLTHAGRRRTHSHSNRSPDDSADLKFFSFYRKKGAHATPPRRMPKRIRVWIRPQYPLAVVGGN